MRTKGGKIRLMFETVKYISCGKFISSGKWIHPNRVIDSHELIFVLEGEVYLNENGVEYVLHKNDILHLEPGVNHFGFRESEDTSFYWVHWTGHPDENMKKQFSPENPYTIFLLFSQLLHYSIDARFVESTDYVIRLILAELYADSAPVTENALVKRVTDWIRSNSSRALTVRDVSDHFGYNADYLSRLLKKQYGQNLKDFLVKSRMEFIKKQLLSNRQLQAYSGVFGVNSSLGEIAAACGFDDYKAFLKFFKYHEKMTPTEFCATYVKTHINDH